MKRRRVQRSEVCFVLPEDEPVAYDKAHALTQAVLFVWRAGGGVITVEPGHDEPGYEIEVEGVRRCE